MLAYGKLGYENQPAECVRLLKYAAYYDVATPVELPDTTPLAKVSRVACLSCENRDSCRCRCFFVFVFFKIWL